MTTKPLALLVHEKLMPGSQLASQFEELEYRVVTLPDPGILLETARKEMPMLVVVDLTHRRREILVAVQNLREDPATAHVPVLAYVGRDEEKIRDEAIRAGVKILAAEAAIVLHLQQFVDQALQLD